MKRRKYGTSFERLNREKKKWARHAQEWEDFLWNDLRTHTHNRYFGEF